MKNSPLNDRTRERTDVYTYSLPKYIKEGNEEPGRSIIKIIFVNGGFSSAIFPFRGLYTRKQWEIMGNIDMEIKAIEKLYKE